MFQNSTSRKLFSQIQILTLISTFSLIACQNNKSTSTLIEPVTTKLGTNSTSSSETLSLVTSTIQDGPHDLNFIRSSTVANSQFIHFKVTGFNSKSSKLYVCLSHVGKVDCSKATSFSQLYPSLDGQNSQLEENIFRAQIDLSKIEIGTYEVRVRKDNMEAIDLDEVVRLITVTEQHVTSPVMNQSDSNYLPLVSGTNPSFQSRFAPSSPSVSVENGSTYLSPRSLGSTDGSMRVTKFKVFIPPGTTRFKADAYLYIDGVNTPAKAAMKFKSPPQTGKDQVSSANAQGQNQTMETLLRGDEMLFYSSGATMALYPGVTSVFKVTEGGYLYMNIIDAPGAIIMGLDTHLIVDQACYESWYANAIFDSSGNPIENAKHTCEGTRF